MIVNSLEMFFSPEKRHQMMQEAAYYCAERRGFESGHQFEDRLTAEHEVNLTCGIFEAEPPWTL